MQKNYFGLAAVFVCAVFLSSCASTKVTADWRDNAYTETPRKALVILAASRPTLTRLFEDEFAKQLSARGVEAVPGYTQLPPDRPVGDKEEIASAVERIQADALFITRLVDRKSYETYYPGSVYSTQAGRYGWRDYQATPGYVVQENILHVETQLYDTKTQQLVWSVMTETRVASSMESEVKDFVKVIMKNLTEKGLVARP
jgi:hypothetical protein